VCREVSQSLFILAISLPSYQIDRELRFFFRACDNEEERFPISPITVDNGWMILLEMMMNDTNAFNRCFFTASSNILLIMSRSRSISIVSKRANERRS